MRAALKAALQGSATISGPCAPVTQYVLERPEGLRHCLFGIPTATAAGKPALVIVLHGAGSSAQQVLGRAFPPSPLSRWLEIAEREHVIVAAPDAGQGGWHECFASAARVARKNDVAWIEAVIDHAIGALDADAQRVYLIGVSRGGWMAYRAAIEIPHRLAAFSAVLANMPPRAHAMQPQRPLPALIVGATDDPLMPYGGGKYWYTLGFSAPVNSIEDSARVWRELAGLPDTPAVTTFPRRHPGERTRSTLTLWGEASDSLQVGLIRIECGGHAEPSGSRRYPGLIGKLVGPQSADFEIAETAWTFFRDKRLARSAGQREQRA